MKGSFVSLQNQSQETRAKVLGLCHISLIRLGDLSRWREELLEPKSPCFSASIEFYELAGRILPQSGTCHNQLAKVCLKAGDKFGMIYELYRSLATEQPHETAKKNLDDGLRDLCRTGQELKKHAASREQEQSSLEDVLLTFQAYCFFQPTSARRGLLEEDLFQHFLIASDQDGSQDVVSKTLLMSLASELTARNSMSGEIVASVHHLARC